MVIENESAVLEAAQGIYNFSTVSPAAMVGMILSAIISIGFPIFLLVFCLKKSKAKLPSFFIGGATFVLFAMLLKTIAVQVLYRGAGVNFATMSASKKVFISAVLVAVFEEVGRYLAMKLVMKKKQLLDLHNSFLYGVGHGGFAAILINGYNCIINVATSGLLNSGKGETMVNALPAEQRSEYFDQLSKLWTTKAPMFYFVGIETILALGLQIALSIIMFQAVKHYRVKYILMALIAHFAVDFVCGIIGSGSIFAAIMAEVVMLVMTLIITVLAFAITGKEKI